MRKLWILWITSIIIGLRFAQAQSCSEIASAAEMARAKSMQALTGASKRAGDSYRAHLILAFRSFQLQPHNKGAAERLLALIPADDTQQTVLMTLGDSLCDEESLAEMTAMARVYEGLARELARAVLLVPSFLPSYVSYAATAVLDPHSEYAVEMKKVCQHAHADFIRAVKELPEHERQVFAKEVMNPNDCRVITLPEAEE
jgi:hypothetical protein